MLGSDDRASEGASDGIDEITVTAHPGPEAAAWAEAIAKLRLTVFREFPYLYDGTLENERSYLESYFRTSEAVCVLARVGERIIGASTGLPLTAENRTFAEPLIAAGFPVAEVFYFGESVLLPEWRRRGIGHRFFDAREGWARALGRVRWTTFCAVDRPADHPARPKNYVPHDRFWKGRGYVRRPGLQVHFPWREVGQTGETRQQLTYWMREWPVVTK